MEAKTVSMYVDTLIPGDKDLGQPTGLECEIIRKISSGFWVRIPNYKQAEGWLVFIPRERVFSIWQEENT